MEFSAVTQCSNDIQGSSGQRDHRSRVTIGRSQVAERERERLQSERGHVEGEGCPCSSRCGLHILEPSLVLKPCCETAPWWLVSLQRGEKTMASLCSAV